MATTADRRLSVRARDAVFAPLNTLGRAETVTRRLSEAIALGLLRDAEQLPSETDLAATFNVSTVTVREALVVLRHRGLVETRRGRGGGSFVTCPPEPPAGSPTMRLAEITSTELTDLCDHYVAISATAAALAADRSGAEDVAAIRASTERFAGARDGGSRRRAESHFHVEVAAAARSPRLARAELELQTEIGPSLWLPYADADAQAHALQQHGAIAAAIEAGDAVLARSITTEHVRQALVHASAFMAPASSDTKMS